MRKTLDLTQREFGERIGVKPNTIATYEIGRNEPIDAVVSLICREFNVSETWLRTGEGEMFEPEEEDAWEEVVKQRGLTQSDRILIEKFMNLKPASRQAVMEYMKKIVAALNDETALPGYEPTPAVDTSGQEQAEPDLAAKVAELERQNQEKDKKLQELAAEIKDQRCRMDAAKEIEPDMQVLDGEGLTTEEAEALYRSSSGYVANADLSALNTTDDTGSSGVKLA